MRKYADIMHSKGGENNNLIPKFRRLHVGPRSSSLKLDTRIIQLLEHL